MIAYEHYYFDYIKIIKHFDRSKIKCTGKGILHYIIYSTVLNIINITDTLSSK